MRPITRPFAVLPRRAGLLAALLAALSTSTAAQGTTGRLPVSPGYPATASVVLTPAQLEQLVSPIALYPDALLAQVLVASTFPDQVLDAAREVRRVGTADVDNAPWDISVKALAHYPSALNGLAESPERLAQLGRAYATQSSDVMAAVQRLRAQAAAVGNLPSNAQQTVTSIDGRTVIAPTQPQIIYVPVYDPILIYRRPVFMDPYASRYWSFGIGFPIGMWLRYELDWNRNFAYVDDWGYRPRIYGGWRERSRPFVLGDRDRDQYRDRDQHRDRWSPDDRRGLPMPRMGDPRPVEPRHAEPRQAPPRQSPPPRHAEPRASDQRPADQRPPEPRMTPRPAKPDQTEGRALGAFGRTAEQHQRAAGRERPPHDSGRSH